MRNKVRCRIHEPRVAFSMGGEPVVSQKYHPDSWNLVDRITERGTMMRNRLYVIASFLICTIAILLITENVLATEKRMVSFYTVENSYVNDYLRDKINDIANGIVLIEKQTRGDIAFGCPMKVLNSDGMFLVPIFMSGDCKYLLTVTVLNDDEVVSSFCSAGSEIINGLSEGRYYLLQSDGNIYVVSENGTYLFGAETEDASRENYPVFDENLINDIETVNIRDYYDIITVSTTGMRSLMSKELSKVPYNQNYGDAIHGCCWLSCAKSISEYYGATNLEFSALHDPVHDYWDGNGVFQHHPFYGCTGGSLTDMLMAIDLGSSKEPSYVNMGVSASSTLTSINNDIPILALWQETGTNSGHATVVTGYMYDNATGSFIYGMMDPNYQSRVYVLSSYSATSLTYTYVYTIQNQQIMKVFSWDKGVGGWH